MKNELERFELYSLRCKRAWRAWRIALRSSKTSRRGAIGAHLARASTDSLRLIICSFRRASKPCFADKKRRQTTSDLSSFLRKNSKKVCNFALLTTRKWDLSNRFLFNSSIIFPISMRLTPFFTMRTECADLSRVSKWKNFNDFTIDNGFRYVTVTVQIHIFTKRGIRYIRNFFEILRDRNIS